MLAALRPLFKLQNFFIFVLMKKINKKLPIDVLREIKDFSKTKRSPNGLFYLVETDDYLFKANDMDESSGFYFHIDSFNEKSGYLISFKPRSTTQVDVINIYTKAQSFSDFFENWYGYLKAYAELEEEEKDPFLKIWKISFLMA
jgi:hypothetical protein